MLVDCFPRKESGWKHPDACHVRLRKTLPFFKKDSSGYTHRIRSGISYYWGDQYRHTAFSFWCGNTGFVDKNGGRMLAEPETGAVICATCEGRAIGAGLCGSPVILGRAVKFSPRILIDVPYPPVDEVTVWKPRIIA